ncbi:MAG: hypothetical protein IKE92_09565 [Clostridiales bacterium]|nr:hypothetical protein [Clostridiales bacterium]
MTNLRLFQTASVTGSDTLLADMLSPALENINISLFHHFVRLFEKIGGANDGK